MPLNYYQILGITSRASAKSIQKAFHGLAKEFHPDKNPNDPVASERFKLISEAYRTLSHPVRKKQYDLKLHYGFTPPQPVRKPPPTRARMYRTSKRPFTKKAKILGLAAVIAILLAVLITSYALVRYNAEYNFQRGISHFENHKYSAAYFNMKQSLGPFNPYKAAAHLIMAEICYLQNANPILTQQHIDKAITAHPSDSILAHLYYLQGKLASKQEDFQSAYLSFEKAVYTRPVFDSARYQLGELDSFVFKRYDQGLTHYQSLIENNDRYFDAFLGAAYCHYQLGQYQAAINTIDHSLTLRSDIGMCYYLKGLCAQELNLPEIACENFSQATQLGVTAAFELSQTFCQTFSN